MTGFAVVDRVLFKFGVHTMVEVFAQEERPETIQCVHLHGLTRSVFRAF